MDWYTVEFLYPVAFNRFKDRMFPNLGIISISCLQHYDLKKLYQFFDKEGVYLITEMCKPQSWVFSVSLSNGVVFGLGDSSKPNRDEIESEGFYECFRILDKKLRENF
jgi:hypothetical protein